MFIKLPLTDGLFLRGVLWLYMVTVITLPFEGYLSIELRGRLRRDGPTAGRAFVCWVSAGDQVSVLLLGLRSVYDSRPTLIHLVLLQAKGLIPTSVLA